MKNFFLISIILLSMTSPLHADLLQDANSVFDWAEQKWDDYLVPPNQPTLQYDVWYYRYYSGSGLYVGVNDKREVYVVGTDLPLTFVATLDQLLDMMAGTPHVAPAGTTGHKSCLRSVNGMKVICTQGGNIPVDTAKSYCEAANGEWIDGDCPDEPAVKCQNTNDGYDLVYFYEHNPATHDNLLNSCAEIGGTVVH
jgi:hypothetical protein